MKVEKWITACEVVNFNFKSRIKPLITFATDVPGNMLKLINTCANTEHFALKFRDHYTGVNAEFAYKQLLSRNDKRQEAFE
jgi:hypothetical protein